MGSKPPEGVTISHLTKCSLTLTACGHSDPVLYRDHTSDVTVYVIFVDVTILPVNCKSKCRSHLSLFKLKKLTGWKFKVTWQLKKNK